MTFEEDVAALERHIESEEAKRDSWRAAGSQERYMEACSMVDALELQLEKLLRIRLTGQT